MSTQPKPDARSNWARANGVPILSEYHTQGREQQITHIGMLTRQREGDRNSIALGGVVIAASALVALVMLQLGPKPAELIGMPPTPLTLAPVVFYGIGVFYAVLIPVGIVAIVRKRVRRVGEVAEYLRLFELHLKPAPHELAPAPTAYRLRLRVGPLRITGQCECDSTPHRSLD